VETFFVTAGMVPVEDMIFCMTDTTVLVGETMVFANEKIFSAAPAMLFGI
jgi:hypothetical protein